MASTLKLFLDWLTTDMGLSSLTAYQYVYEVDQALQAAAPRPGEVDATALLHHMQSISSGRVLKFKSAWRHYATYQATRGCTVPDIQRTRRATPVSTVDHERMQSAVGFLGLAPELLMALRWRHVSWFRSQRRLSYLTPDSAAHPVTTPRDVAGWLVLRRYAVVQKAVEPSDPVVVAACRASVPKWVRLAARGSLPVLFPEPEDQDYWPHEDAAGSPFVSPPPYSAAPPPGVPTAPVFAAPPPPPAVVLQKPAPIGLGDPEDVG